MINGQYITDGIENLSFSSDTVVCIILEHTADKEFLTRLANDLLDRPCRSFNFYGKYSGRGESVFDRTDIERGYTDETIALTRCYFDIEMAAKGICVEILCRKREVIVLYDDLSVYQQILNRIKKTHPFRFRKVIAK